LNNTGDSAHLVYYEEILDTLTWDFSVPDDYVLTHENLEFLEFEVQVIRAVDGDTVVIEFEDGRIEKLRLV
jgi:endonuclease YncB( thermonuclease family)